MPPPKNALSKDRVAQILVTATLYSDSYALSHYDIASRTLDRYKSQLAADPELKSLYQRHYEKLAATWTLEINSTLREALSWIRNVLPDLPKDTETLREVVTATEQLAAIELTQKQIEVSREIEREKLIRNSEVQLAKSTNLRIASYADHHEEVEEEEDSSEENSARN